MRLVSPLLAHRRITIAVTAAAVVAIGAALVWLRDAGTHDASPADLILLADPVNETGDTLLDRSVAAAATVALQQSKRLAVYPRARVPAVYRLMEIANTDTALSFELAQEVAERARVRFVVGVRTLPTATGYRVNARLADVQARRTVGDFTKDARGQSDVLDALDNVLVGVRRAVGESRRQTAATHVPLPIVTTRSLAALRSYADGQRAWDIGDFERATEYFRRATDLDTGFALAYGALGSVSYLTHDRQAGDRYYGEALARATRLSPREQLALRERRASLSGNIDSAVILARIETEQFPSAYSWDVLGRSLRQLGRRIEADSALQKSVALDPKNTSALIELATNYSELGRTDSSIMAYQRAAAIDSGLLYHNNANSEYGSELVAAGRFAQAETTFRHMATEPRLFDRSLGFRSLAYVDLWQGRIPDAVAAIQGAVDAMHQQGSPLSEGRNRLILATIYRVANRVPEANAEVDRALTFVDDVTYEPLMLAIAGYDCHQLGRARDVEMLARKARQRARPDARADRAAIAFLDAAVQLSAHHADSAITDLRAASAFTWPLPRLMLLAEAFTQAGQRDSARATLAALRAIPGFGTEGEEDWLHAPLLLGDALLDAHDTTAAVKQYQSVLTQWRDAPSELPDMAAAKRRLAAISATHPRG